MFDLIIKGLTNQQLKKIAEIAGDICMTGTISPTPATQGAAQDPVTQGATQAPVTPAQGAAPTPVTPVTPAQGAAPTPVTQGAVQDPVTPAQGAVPAVELDSENRPWDARIHSKNKTTNTDGTWRLKRCPKGTPKEEFDALIEQVRAEHQGTTPVTQAQKTVPENATVNPTPELPPVPTDQMEWLNSINNLTMEFAEFQQTILQPNFGVSNIPEIMAAIPDNQQAIWRTICQMQKPA